MTRRDRSKDPPKAAAELMSELDRDPHYVARTRQRQEQQSVNVENYVRAAEPVLKELAATGIRVNTIGDLRQRAGEYHSAVPILVRWLPRIADLQVKEDIVRTLSVPWARQAAPVFIEEFKKADDVTSPGLRWAIANGLAVTADVFVFEELVRLARDERYGKSRAMLVLALGNVQNPQATGVLMDLLADEQVVGHAVMALGKLRASAARPRIEALLQYPAEWVREEARKALANFEAST